MGFRDDQAETNRVQEHAIPLTLLKKQRHDPALPTQGAKTAKLSWKVAVREKNSHNRLITPAGTRFSKYLLVTWPGAMMEASARES